jgi:hypothetical protein
VLQIRKAVPRKKKEEEEFEKFQKEMQASEAVSASDCFAKKKENLHGFLCGPERSGIASRASSLPSRRRRR